VARVLILGHGLAGSAIARAFTADGHRVITPSRGEVDVLNAHTCAEGVFHTAPDVVVDCSGAAEAHDDSAAAGIVNAARNVASAAEAIDAHVIYLSCARVFDGGDREAYAESVVPAPESRFGRAKAAAERVIAEVCERHTIVRTAWLFGVGRPNFVTALIEHGRSGDHVIVAQARPSSPTHAADLAVGIAQLIAPPRYGVFHVAATGSCTPVQLVRNAFRLEGIDVKVSPGAGQQATVILPPSGPALVSVRGPIELPSWRAGLAAYLDLLAGSSVSPTPR
jgi:dTDP-4-dehydrorhamnose reductase